MSRVIVLFTTVMILMISWHSDGLIMNKGLIASTLLHLLFNIETNNYYYNNNNEILKANLPEYLERTINIPSIKKKLKLIQGFSINKNKTPSTDGDRTGTYTWPGGIELGDKLDTIVHVRNKKVIELGTGTGIVGISAYFRNPSIIAMTDGADEVLSIAQKNIETNLNIKLKGNIEFSEFKNKLSIGKLRWGNNDDIEKWVKLYGKFDILLASEVAYEHRSIDLLLGTIKELLKDEGVAVLRLTPEITDDSRGFDSLLTTMKKNFDLISFPFIGDANSQIFVLHLKYTK